MHFGVNSKKMFGWGDIEVSSVFKRFEQLYNEEHGFTSREQKFTAANDDGQNQIAIGHTSDSGDLNIETCYMYC